MSRDRITITVPSDKAEHLLQLASATTETLRILASKCKGKTEKDFVALETKLKTFQGFI